MSDYYSTQTSLADHIAEAYYRIFYVYVAEEFNPAKNDPTSNPQLIRQQWCRVAMGQLVLSDEGDDVWFDHRQKLKNIALRRAERNLISNRTKEQIQHAIIHAEAGDASPVVYHIPGSSSAVKRLHHGDYKTKFPENVEYIVGDLNKSEFTRHLQNCGEPSEFELVAERKDDAED